MSYFIFAQMVMFIPCTNAYPKEIIILSGRFVIKGIVYPKNKIVSYLQALKSALL